jgi:ABC-type Mn2+/Zn2+ transport system ATPase subunit
MILHSVRIENFKAIRGPLDVVFEPNSPNLLEGPNGAGKSTLVEAMERCLLDSHNGTGTSVEEMRPRETALTPSIAVEFSHAGTVYRIAKTFLDSPKALLDRKRADGVYDTIAKGKAADEQVRDMLRSQPTKAKDRPGERMGLLSVLCSSQGRIALPALSGDALADVRSMLGAAVSGSRGLAFENAVTRKHTAVWTPGGKPKKGKLSELQMALTGARQDLETYAGLMERVGSLEASALDQRSRSKGALEQLRLAQAEYSPLEALAQRVVDLRLQRIPAASRLDAVNARYSQLRAEIDRIVEAADKKRRCEEARPRLVEAETAAKQTRDLRVQEASAARTAWEASCQPSPDVQQAETKIERATAFLQLGKELATVRVRLSCADKAAQVVARLKHAMVALNAPDASAWKLIQTVGRDFDQAAMKVEALALRLEITAETDLKTNVIAGDPAGDALLRPGESLVARGDGVLTVSLPGIATLHFAGPSGDSAQWRAQRDEKHVELRRLLEPFGVAGWHDLIDRVHQREALSGELARATAEYEAAVGADTVEGLREVEFELTTRYGETLALEPLWAGQPPDLGALKAESAARKQEWDARQGEGRQEWGTAETRRSGAEALAGAAAEMRAANDRELVAAQQALALLAADGLTMGERQQGLTDKRRECESAADGLREIDVELAGLPKDAPERAAAMRRRIAGLEAEGQSAREAYQRDEAAAQAILLQGPYSSLAVAEERVRQLEADEAAEKLRLDAIRLLTASLDAAKAKVLEGVAEPVEARATALLERIAGRPLARIRLGNGMALEGVQPEGCNVNAAVEQLSAGEQEQVYFATRLALAEVIGGQERQALILDDPMVNSDADRLARILELIQEQSGRFQFIILTCHPARYLELHGAVTRHMGKLEQAAPETPAEVHA